MQGRNARSRLIGRLISCFLCGCVGIATVARGAVINEIRIDQPGTDKDEYFELAGSAGESLAGLTYLVIGDSGSNNGIVETTVNLGGLSIPSDGFFLAAESTFSLAGSPDLTTSLNFENGDNVTHLLVSGFTGANGNDLDTDDDGTLDSTPWGAIIDSLALLDSLSGGDRVYSATTIGPHSGSVPTHVLRNPDGSGPWQIGDSDPSAGGDTPGVSATPLAMPLPDSLSLMGIGIAMLGCAVLRRRTAS